MERKWLELSVGLFLIIGIACLAYLSINLGRIPFWSPPGYVVRAIFSNVGGLKTNANVTMAGVNIGQVESIRLKDGRAMVTLRIQNDVALEDDVIASIKTKGLIGDKFISVSPGASDQTIKPGGAIQDTQPPLDIENLLGKFVFGNLDKTEKK
jgi:phospholipid/cholesterol/gamma-HCH transport system substrate-binding protein